MKKRSDSYFFYPPDGQVLSKWSRRLFYWCVANLGLELVTIGKEWQLFVAISFVRERHGGLVDEVVSLQLVCVRDYKFNEIYVLGII